MARVAEPAESERFAVRLLWLLAGSCVAWVVGIVLVAALLQDVMISWARGWPGGAYGFLLSMAVLAPTGLAGIALAWNWRMHGGGPLRGACAAAFAAVVAGSTVIPLLAAAPRGRDDSGAAPEFQTWVTAAAPGAFWWALAVSFVTIIGWSFVVAKAAKPGKPTTSVRRTKVRRPGRSDY
ncbi:hypothetical protein [Streptomyces sp. FXJ7.023]|uniref:hypothetical protein n=1 Tax=Streptomyces sp. FXJ7.023 TaxID=579932 RepID=UPI00055FC82C|nr:hypothetical protein [Streptomyces sp. FXJ7.023]